jgi:hypothetical protein
MRTATRDSPTAGGDVPGAPSALPGACCRHLAHDIAVEISTLRLLAEAVTNDAVVQGVTRARVERIIAEADVALEMLRGPLKLDGAVGRAELATTVQEVVRTARLLPRARVSVGPVPSGAVALEPQALRRALVNLVENAIRAAGRGGTVSVQAFTQGPCARVEVQDSGPGFGHAPGGRAAVGLTNVRSMVSPAGGYLDIGRTASGQTVVALVIPWLDASDSTEEAS